MEMKIGQEIAFTKDFEIQGYSDTKQIKKGDKGFIDSNGFIHYTSGEARGKIQKFDDIEVKGYDHEGITNIIMKYLNYFSINDVLEDYDISQKDFKEKIEEALDEIF